MKFGRKCQLKVEIDPRPTGDGATMQASNTLTIPRNATIEFEINRGFISSSQTATFRIHNLAEQTRDRIQRDPFATGDFRAIQFRAGYEDFPIALCFNGLVQSATSYRGSPGMVTEIHAVDGALAMASGFTAQTLGAGISVRETLVALAKSLPRISGEPLVGDFPGTNLRGKVLFGNTWSLILQESGNLATIDNGQVKVLQLNEAVAAAIPLIDSSTGLLGSPRRTPTTLEFEMLFEPRLTIGQILALRSSTNRLYDGTYKVAGFHHRGVAPSTGEDSAAAVTPVSAAPTTSKVLLFVGPDELTVIRGTPVL